MQTGLNKFHYNRSNKPFYLLFLFPFFIKGILVIFIILSQQILSSKLLLILILIYNLNYLFVYPNQSITTYHLKFIVKILWTYHFSTNKQHQDKWLQKKSQNTILSIVTYYFTTHSTFHLFIIFFSLFISISIYSHSLLQPKTTHRDTTTTRSKITTDDPNPQQINQSWFKKYYIHNIFITNSKWQIVTGCYFGGRKIISLVSSNLNH